LLSFFSNQSLCLLPEVAAVAAAAAVSEAAVATVSRLWSLVRRAVAVWAAFVETSRSSTALIVWPVIRLLLLDPLRVVGTIWWSESAAAVGL